MQEMTIENTDNSGQSLNAPAPAASPAFRQKMKTGLTAGAQKGWSGFCWMLKILIPVSLFTVLLEYSGLLGRIDFLLSPLMGLLSLPPQAALPIVAGMLTGIYGGIAAMVALPLTVDQMTLIAIFILISHSMIQEGIIQGKSGMHPAVATLLRLAASVVTVMACAAWLRPEAGASAAPAAGTGVPGASLSETLIMWAAGSLWLSLKILGVVMGLMMALGLMKSFNLIPKIVRLMTPALWLMGLNRRVGILWVTAAVFGIGYGAAVIVEEARDGNLEPEELTRLHASIGINHSLVEDPALFLPLGIGAFWLWVPRLITAMATVHLLALWRRLRRREAIIAPAAPPRAR